MFRYLFIYVIFIAAVHGSHAFARTKRVAELKGYDTKSQGTTSVVKGSKKDIALHNLKSINSDTKISAEKTFNLIDNAELNKLQQETEKLISGRHRKDIEAQKNDINGDSAIFKHPVNDINKFSKIYEKDEHGNKENFIRFERGAHNTQDVATLKHKQDNKRDTKVLKRKISHTPGEHFCPKKTNPSDDTSKLEGGKRETKPDLDIFFYSNVSPLYKAPPLLLEMYNSKEMSPFEHYYSPYKFLHRRSPIQSALEIANMMVKVGLDDLDSEDYGDSGIHTNVDGKPVARRSLKLVDQNFCPVHRNGGETGNQEYGECICGYHQKNVKDDTTSIKEDGNKASKVEPNAILAKLAIEADSVLGKGSSEVKT